MIHGGNGKQAVAINFKSYVFINQNRSIGEWKANFVTVRVSGGKNTHKGAGRLVFSKAKIAQGNICGWSVEVGRLDQKPLDLIFAGIIRHPGMHHIGAFA